MKLYYITDLSIPTKKAFGYGVSKMCENLGVLIPVTLICTKGNEKDNIFDFYSIKNTFDIRHISVPRFYSNNRYTATFYSFLRKFFFYFRILLLKTEKDDIFYTRDMFSLLFLRLKTKNIFLEIHYLSRGDKILMRILFLAKKIIVITSFLKETLVKYGIEEKKIHIAPDATDLSDFDIKESKMELRQKLNLPLDKKIVLYTGNLYEWKGVYTLVDAVKYLPADIFAVFVGGSDDLILKFRSYVEEKKESRISIVGFQRHSMIPLYLKSADVLVLPNSDKEEISKFNTSPIKLFEYMASNCPIVASDLPSIREVLNEKNSLLVKSDDARALATGIGKILEDNERANRRAAVALSDSGRYTWEKRAKHIKDFILLP